MNLFVSGRHCLCLWQPNTQTLHHWVRLLVSGVYYYCFLSCRKMSLAFLTGCIGPNLQSGHFFFFPFPAADWYLEPSVGQKQFWVLTLMKDPSPRPQIDVNKYFPQPRSIRIKARRKGGRGEKSISGEHGWCKRVGWCDEEEKGGEKKDRVMTEVYKNTRAGIHSLQI